MSEQPFRRNILLIEDDRILNGLIADQLTEFGFNVESKRLWREARVFLDEHEPDLILLDIRLPDADGLELIPELVKNAPVIVLTAYGTIENAVRAMKFGAAEYLAKPINLEELEIAVQRALENAELRAAFQFVRSRQRAKRKSKSFMVGHSPVLRDVIGLIKAVAQEDTTVLIQGESGVGKELVAREIHERSPRTDRNFVALDCCTIQENLFESELFGHEKGAFTGASKQKKGLIEGADGGTLFLDEIGEITPAVQAKLLRVIETGQFRRLGGVKNLSSNARIVTATNRDLEDMVSAGDFRADLYYRLNTFVIHVPPLRERREDIPDLVRHFLANHNFSRRISKELIPDTVRLLMDYEWPGNVRELRNVIERAIITSGDAPLIEPGHIGLPEARAGVLGKVQLSFDHEPTLEEVKKSYIENLMIKYAGRRAKLAESLGVSERNVYRMIKKYKIKDSQLK